jgi:hypothetical protein
MKLCIAVYLLSCTTALSMLEEYDPSAFEHRNMLQVNLPDSPQTPRERSKSLGGTPKISHHDLLEYLEAIPPAKTLPTIPSSTNVQDLNENFEDINLDKQKYPQCPFCTNWIEKQSTIQRLAFSNNILLECGCWVHTKCMQSYKNNPYLGYAKRCPQHNDKEIPEKIVTEALHSARSDERREKAWNEVKEFTNKGRQCGCMPKEIRPKDSSVFALCCARRK